MADDAEDAEDEPPAPAHSPLAYNRAGEPVQLDPSCVCFRVVYAKPGPVVAVPSAAGGPLYSDLTATPAELRQQTGAGKFALLQCNGDAEAIDDAEPAYIEFGQVVAGKSAPTGQTDADKLLQAVIESNKALRESVETLTKSLTGALNSLTGQGVKPPTEKKGKDDDDKDEPTDWLALAQEYGPMIQFAGRLFRGESLPAAGEGTGGTNGSGPK